MAGLRQSRGKAAAELRHQLIQPAHQLQQARHLYSSNPQLPQLHHITHRRLVVTPTTRWFHISTGNYINYSKRRHRRGHRSYHRYSGGSSYSSYRIYTSYISGGSGSNYISPAAATSPLHPLAAAGRLGAAVKLLPSCCRAAVHLLCSCCLYDVDPLWLMQLL